MTPSVNRPSITRFILFPLIGVVAILLAGFAALFFQFSVKAHDSATEETLRTAQNAFQLELEERTNKMSLALFQLSQNPEFAEAFLRADRTSLQMEALKIFGAFQTQHNITHFYFADVNRAVFLRVHQPDRHGDTIARYTMTQAVATGGAAHGLELGPLGTLTLRVVYPWRVEGQLIGYIELGEEIENLIATVSGQFNPSLAVAIEKQYLDREKWQTGMAMLGREANWDRFESNILLQSEQTVLDDQSIVGFLGGHRQDSHTVAFNAKAVDGAAHRVLLQPLIDAGGRKVGHFIYSLNTANHIAALWRSISIVIGIGVAFAIAVSAIFACIVRRLESRVSRAEASRAKAYDELEMRVEDRTRDLTREVAERVRAEEAMMVAKEEAELASRSKSEFLANMSHELRTPLNAIIGFSDLLAEEAFGPLGNGEYKKFSHAINDSGQHLLELINDVLDISKIEAGAVSLREESFDAIAVIDSCIATIANRAAEGDVKLIADIAETKLPPLHADKTRITQVVLNLLTNAIKFTEAGGQVTLKAWHNEDSGFVLQVIDTGIGIAAGDIPKALARFQQVEGELNRKHQGTGLGLPLTKSLVEQHGGSLDLQSELGVGTTVTVRLPVTRTIMAAA